MAWNFDIIKDMMNIDDLKKLVSDHIDLIEINKNAFQEARQRAAIFLVIQAHLTNHLKDLEDFKVKASTIEKAQ